MPAEPQTETRSETAKVAAFRALHRPGDPFILPNPWDLGTVRILEAAGFKALATTSAGFAFSLGQREGRLTHEAVLGHCRAMAEASALPVSADLEKGFGDRPESVAETITAAATTGLAGASIEDHTGRAEDPIYPLSLATERIAAAVEAARAVPGGFVLTARAENYLWQRPDLDDTIARLQAFEAAGADVLYAPGLRDIETIRTLCSALLKPVNVIMGLPKVALDRAALAEAGVARISVGSALARLAYGRVVEAAREMAEAGSFGFGAEAMGFAELEAQFPPHADL
ncbi:MAG: isocitrate lyase/phosphoenolpyruvate mutase family protein [Pseudomonadota bacterium]